MKQWLETTRVLDEIAALGSRGGRAALATVVRVRGSAYRRPGARLLVAGDGSTVGNVSGGCLEQDVREVALRVIATGQAERRRYCSGADPVDAWDLGVGCEGEVELHIEPVCSSRAHLRAQLDADLPFDFCTLVEEGVGGGGEGLLLAGERATGTLGDRALDDAVAEWVRGLEADNSSAVHEIAGREIFIDRFQPPPRLVVFGAGDDALPLVRLALQTGFRVTVVDRRTALLVPERFPPQVTRVAASPARLADRLVLDGQCYALLMTHNYADDRGYADALAHMPLSYLGFLGPRARTERILQSLGASTLLDDPRLFGPVGLDIGTEGAEQVAVAVVAELLSVRSGRAGGHLRDRCVPIHAAAD